MVTAPLAASQPQAPPIGLRADGRPFATPFVRAQAVARGIDLTNLRPSGLRRRIDVADLDVHANQIPSTSAPAASTAVTSIVEVDVTLAVRHAEANGAPLLVLLMQAVAHALPHPVTLRILQYSTSGLKPTLVCHASDLSAEGLEQALSRGDEDGPADFLIADVSGLNLQSTALPLDESQSAALSMGVTTPRVAVGGANVIAFRSTVQLALTHNPHLIDLVAAAGLLSVVRREMEVPR